MKRNYKVFATLTIISGILHFLVVSMMHRENFVELWFFTSFGLTQLFLGFQVLYQEKKSNFLLLAVILNGIFLVLWIMTRIFNAPFATYSEGLTSFDSLISLLEIASFWFAIKIFKLHNMTSKKIFLISALSVVLGLTSYGTAKASEMVFKSIPMSKHAHSHSIMDMFKAPVRAENTQQFNVMGIEMNEEQAREHCNLLGMEQMDVCNQFRNDDGEITPLENDVYVPEGHDNSDGHHG